MLFENYRKSLVIKNHLKCRHIIVGDYSYYSGYYHGKSFEECVLYLDELDSDTAPHELDKLIIGRFCSIASGAQFMLGGTHGHNYNWIANYPLDQFDDVFEGYKGHQWKGDTIYWQ